MGRYWLLGLNGLTQRFVLGADELYRARGLNNRFELRVSAPWLHVVSGYPLPCSSRVLCKGQGISGEVQGGTHLLFKNLQPS